jgi:hypothetical protein
VRRETHRNLPPRSEEIWVNPGPYLEVDTPTLTFPPMFREAPMFTFAFSPDVLETPTPTFVLELRDAHPPRSVAARRAIATDNTVILIRVPPGRTVP